MQICVCKPPIIYSSTPTRSLISEAYAVVEPLFYKKRERKREKNTISTSTPFCVMTPCFHAACYSNLLSHLIFMISGALQPQSAPQKTKPSTRGWGGGKRSTVLEATSRKERQARSLSESNPLQKFTYSTVTTGVSAICFQRDVKKRRTTWNATPMERARTRERNDGGRLP